MYNLPFYLQSSATSNGSVIDPDPFTIKSSSGKYSILLLLVETSMIIWNYASRMYDSIWNYAENR
jgi:hypothetical protein